MSTKIFAIVDSDNGTFIRIGTKCGWVSVGAAKSALLCHRSQLGLYNIESFAEQSRYEVVDLTEAYYRLEGLMK
jgi:hypothetical protein